MRTNLRKATRHDDPALKGFLDDPPSWYGTTSENVATALVAIGAEKVG